MNTGLNHNTGKLSNSGNLISGNLISWKTSNWFTFNNYMFKQNNDYKQWL